MIANRVAYGNMVHKLAMEDERITVVDSDCINVLNYGEFIKDFPDRFFECGIAEQNMVSIAAGLASCGNGYSVKIVGTHAGLETGFDGVTHQAIEDMAIMRAIPGLRVLAPSTPNMTAKLTRLMAETDGPFYMRFGREINQEYYPENMEFTLGGSRLLRDGDRLTVMACGRMVDFAVRAADQLIKEGIRVRVVDMYSIKPIDGKAIEAAVSDTACILTVEDHNTIGGLGGAVSEYVTEHCPCKVLKMGMRDEFGRSGSSTDLFEMYGLTADSIAARIRELLE